MERNSQAVRGPGPGHPFLHQLKHAIWPLHEATESNPAMHKLLDKSISKAGYQQVLARLYGFMAPLEEAVDASLNGAREALRYDPLQPSRLEDLRKDLRYFQMDDEAMAKLPRCPNVPALYTEAHAMGACYLMEGSRLGGLLLAKSLYDKFGFTPDQGITYFASGGEDVKQLWLRFARAITRFVDAGGDCLTIINAAMVGFAQLNGWLRGVRA